MAHGPRDARNDAGLSASTSWDYHHPDHDHLLNYTASILNVTLYPLLSYYSSSSSSDPNYHHRRHQQQHRNDSPLAGREHQFGDGDGEDDYDEWGEDADWHRESAYPFYRAAHLVVLIVFPVLVVLGTAGNGLVIAVLRRRAVRTDNLRFFLSALAVTDTVFLYTSGLKTWVRLVWGFELLYLGSWSCKLGLFLNQMSLTLSAWLLVIITCQRWYTCSQPFRRWCCPSESRRWRYAGLAALVLALTALNGYVLVTVELIKDPDGHWMCGPKREFNDVVAEVFPFILITLYSVVPALLLFILNGLLVRILYRSRRALLTTTNAGSVTARTVKANNHGKGGGAAASSLVGAGTRAARGRREAGRGGQQVRARYNYVTAVLLALSTLWLVLTFPLTVVKLVERMPDDEQEHALLVLINVLLYVLIYINHSANFFIYFALLRGFRREVKRMARGAARYATSVQVKCSKGDHTTTTSLSVTNATRHCHNHNHNHDHNWNNNDGGGVVVVCGGGGSGGGSGGGGGRGGGGNVGGDGDRGGVGGGSGNNLNDGGVAGGNQSHADSFMPLLVHADGMWHLGREVNVVQ